MKKKTPDFEIQELGEPTVPSPVTSGYFTPDSKRIRYDRYLHNLNSTQTSKETPPSIEIAGPRKMIYFDPKTVKAAIVTCGGLSPGINDVIRAVVMGLYYRYGVRNIAGIRYGFQGLIPEYRHEVISLTPEVVKDIHMLGGSVLSLSRGGQDIVEMVDALCRMNINIFFCIGGDGTMKAAELITKEIDRRDLKISVIGIPKTIDNDLNLIDKTFGFDTAISMVVNAIQCAHVEAKGAPMGIGLVKIMGRESGHIVLSAALAQNDVNLALIPEVPFDLEGEKGLFKALEKRLRERKHAVILVAEGAGQELCAGDNPKQTDASGNIRLNDIGVYLKTSIEEYFKERKLEINLKYIDPSYTIRSVPANASDSIYCELLGQLAMHAGMAGKTGMVVGLFNGEYVHLPLKSVAFRKKVDTKGNLWMRVLEATGQPVSMKN
ncbi:MAG: ATP-dependent 6-phosphofructokinase [Deltaproteobacteria bacterium]|nr:ATP-dependent 6-phosphofructokinase [Deltaproteobacteria bacterium]MBW2595271.1 ATP-dependent 6-phosphofructokinase [Deltaproteobacteria bacterium]MBW2649843.1 ATP-dependent 6-phosphofructokinase [Deltaproteobacteria bacterium]